MLQLLEHFTNLFVVTLFVITNKGNCSHAIHLAQEGMFEDEIAEALFAMSGAECLEITSAAVKVFNCTIASRRIHRINRFRAPHFEKPQGNDGSRNEAAQETNSPGFTSNRGLEFFCYASFDKTEMVNYFRNTPFAFSGTLCIDGWLERQDAADKFLMDRVQSFEGSLHRHSNHESID